MLLQAARYHICALVVPSGGFDAGQRGSLLHNQLYSVVFSILSFLVGRKAPTVKLISLEKLDFPFFHRANQLYSWCRSAH